MRHINPTGLTPKQYADYAQNDVTIARMFPGMSGSFMLRGVSPGFTPQGKGTQYMGNIPQTFNPIPRALRPQIKVNRIAPMNFPAAPTVTPRSLPVNPVPAGQAPGQKFPTQDPFSFPENALPFLGAGASLGSQLPALLEGPQDEDPRYNRFQPRALQLARRRVNFSPARQSIVRGSEAQLQSIRSSTRSQGASRALMTKAFENMRRQLAGIDVQQSTSNTQLDGQEASMLMQAGERDRQAETQIDFANLANRAKFFDKLEQFGSSVNEVAKIAENNRVAGKQADHEVGLMNLLSKDFMFARDENGDFKLIPKR